VRYRGERPVRRSSFYVGEFTKVVKDVDGTTLEMFIDEADVDSRRNSEYAATELANALRVFRKLLGPLDLSVFRTVSTPTFHGRGFTGLLLLSGYGGFRGDLSGSDVFRAHEVAHQWWGGLVDVRDWPRDRWIMESFAEYVAMEYYRIRFPDPARFRDAINRSWFLPETFRPDEQRKRLDGDKHFVPGYALWPLSFGNQNVYTKGPLVLHMLRYVFRAKRSSDAGFWELMRQVQADHRDLEISTEEFITLAEKALGEPIPWFWAQWLHGTDVPALFVSQKVTESDGAWTVTVHAKQEKTGFTLAVPVYLHFKGNRQATVPLWIDAKGGKAEIKLKEKPESVTLNDYYEALVTFR